MLVTRAGLSEDERGLAVVNGWLVETSTKCDCSGGVYGHMPECGLSPIGKVDDLLRDAARTADLAAQVARVAGLACSLVNSPHAMARSIGMEIDAALSPAQPDTERGGRP